LRLIETFRWEPDAGFLRLQAHIARMTAGAATLGFPFDRKAVDRALARVAGAEPLRVRLTLAPDGTAEAEWVPLGAGRAHWTLVVAHARLRSDDPWLRVKTSRRQAYDAARAALPAGVDEAVFLNERGEVCEGAITTVFANLGEGLITPPLACGLLPGILRAEMLTLGRAREGLLGVDDLVRAQLFVGNALRGLIPARLAAAPDRAGG
jgi:4-amino-4-deoxychorismate lyase